MVLEGWEGGKGGSGLGIGCHLNKKCLLIRSACEVYFIFQKKKLSLSDRRGFPF